MNRFRLEGEMVMSIVVGRRLVVVISSRVVGSAADGHGRPWSSSSADEDGGKW